VLFVISSCTKCNSYRILVGTADEKRTLGIPRLRGEGSIKKDLKDYGAMMRIGSGKCLVEW